jgi:hypothetical protein
MTREFTYIQQRIVSYNATENTVELQNSTVKLQNMDGFFYFSEVRKESMLKALKDMSRNEQ